MNQGFLLPFHAPSMLLVVCLITAGCDVPTSDTDPPLVPDSIMAELFIEFHLLEARADVSQEDMDEALNDSILMHYGVDEDAYKATIRYYTDNPTQYLDVYTDALDKLSDERFIPIE